MYLLCSILISYYYNLGLLFIPSRFSLHKRKKNPPVTSELIETPGCEIEIYNNQPVSFTRRRAADSQKWWWWWWGPGWTTPLVHNVLKLQRNTVK